VGECLELGNLELFDRQLKNSTETRTCKKPHLKLTKIPTRIESFKEPKTQFGDTASLAHCEDRRPDQQISVPSRMEESQPKLIELVSSTRKRKTEATETGSSGLTGRSHRTKNSKQQRRCLGQRTADNHNIGAQREPKPMRKRSWAERADDWTSGPSACRLRIEIGGGKPGRGNKKTSKKPIRLKTESEQAGGRGTNAQHSKNRWRQQIGEALGAPAGDTDRDRREALLTDKEN
jgi:hypothetical protein